LMQSARSSPPQIARSVPQHQRARGASCGTAILTVPLGKQAAVAGRLLCQLVEPNANDDSGTSVAQLRWDCVNGPKTCGPLEEKSMNGIIYLVGLVVVIIAVLSFLGLH
jgi:hypothetical protein